MTKVVFETATLADAVKKAERISPNKGQAFDKAAGFVMEIVGSGMPVVVRSTNLEVFSMEWIDTVSIEGDATSWRVPAGLFAQVIASLPIGSGKEVTLEEVTSGFSTQLHLQSGRTKAKFNLLDVSHYPSWEVFDPDDLFVVNDLGGRLGMVDWAADRSIPPINGVHLNGEYAIATDRYRLAITELNIGELENPLTLPSKILSQVLRQTGEISIGVKGTEVLIMPDEHTQLRSVTYMEPYPNVLKIVESATFTDKVEVPKDALLEILNRAANFAGGDRIPVLKLFIGKGEIAVMMSNEEVGLLGDVLETPGFCDHSRIEMKFTPRNIIEAIANCPNQKMDFHYNSVPAKRSMVYIDGGSGYQTWVMGRSEDGGGS